MQRHPFAAASLQHPHLYLKDDLAQTMSEDAHKLPAIRSPLRFWWKADSENGKGSEDRLLRS